MQSQLAAALLGHNTNATSTPSHLDDDENNSFREEDTEVEQEEFDEVFLFFLLSCYPYPSNLLQYKNSFSLVGSSNSSLFFVSISLHVCPVKC